MNPRKRTCERNSVRRSERERRNIRKEIERGRVAVGERERERGRDCKIRRYLKQKKNRGSAKLSVLRGNRGFACIKGNWKLDWDYD